MSHARIKSCGELRQGKCVGRAQEHMRAETALRGDSQHLRIVVGGDNCLRDCRHCFRPVTGTGCYLQNRSASTMIAEPRFKTSEIILPLRNIIEVVIFRGAITVIDFYHISAEMP